MSEAQANLTNEDIAARNMEAALRRLERQVPPPRQVLLHGNPVLRYVEQTIQQAIVVKLARYISMLNAARILMECGHVHEQGLLQRAMDETESDIAFLSLAVAKNDFTDRHREFLKEFWKEEFDAPKAIESTQDRAPPKRDKIRAYVAKYAGPDPSTAIKADRSLFKSYSGYVHGAAPHVMDLYGLTGMEFSVRGVTGTYRHEEHRQDLWNYFYRGLCACALAASGVGCDEVFESMRRSASDYANACGRRDL